LVRRKPDRGGQSGAKGPPNRLPAASRLRVETGSDKRGFVDSLGARHCDAVGNGRNDAPKLMAAALGIAIIDHKGVHSETSR
jgi:soluble P-type ATPase